MYTNPEVHFLNPAALAFGNEYHLGFYHRFEQNVTPVTQRDWGLLVVDTHEDVTIPAGFSYVNVEKNLNGVRNAEEDYQLSLGLRVHEQMALGLTVHRWLQRPQNGAEDALTQLGLGMMFSPLQAVSLGAVAYNVLDDHRPEVRPEMALAGQYQFEDLFRFNIDGIYPTKYNPQKKGILMAGGETLFSNGMRFRFGGRWDDVANKAYGAVGVGWDGPRLAMDWAYEQDMRQNEQFRQSFDLRVFF